MQTLTAELTEALRLEQQRCAAAYQEIWSNAYIATKDNSNLNLGLFFGRAEDYEKLAQTLDEADNAFRSGNRRIALSKTLDVFKQAKEIMSRVGWALNPDPYLHIPSDWKEAKEFVDDATKIVREYAADAMEEIASLSKMEKAMAELENCNATQQSLKQQIAETQRCMEYAPHKSASSTMKAPAPPQSVAPPKTTAPAVCDYELRSHKCWADLDTCQKSCEAAYFNQSLTTYRDCLEGTCNKQHDACLDWANQCR
jgi:hypothetical protein